VSAPDPDKLRKEVDELMSAGNKIVQLYAQLYANGYRSRRSGGTEKVSGGTFSDVCDLLQSSGNARAKFEECGRRVMDANAAMKGSLGALHDIAGMLDKNVVDESRDVSTGRDVEFPNLLEDHEHARIKKIAKRRTRAMAQGKGRLPWSQTEVDGS
jgi:hypothetical protein